MIIYIYIYIYIFISIIITLHSLHAMMSSRHELPCCPDNTPTRPPMICHPVTTCRTKYIGVGPLDPDCHLEGAAARRSKFGCFSIRNHIRNAPFWRGPPDPTRQVRIAGSGAGARSPPGIFNRCMLISRFFKFFKFFRGFSSCVQLFRDFSK